MDTLHHTFIFLDAKIKPVVSLPPKVWCKCFTTNYVRLAFDQKYVYHLFSSHPGVNPNTISIQLQKSSETKATRYQKGARSFYLGMLQMSKASVLFINPVGSLRTEDRNVDWCDGYMFSQDQLIHTQSQEGSDEQGHTLAWVHGQRERHQWHQR